MLSLLLIRRLGRLLGRLGCGLIWRSCICCRFWRWIGWNFRRIGFIFRCIGLCFSCLICCPNTRCRILDENFSKKKLVTKYQNTHGPSKNASQNAYINDPKLHIERILSRSQIKRRGQKNNISETESLLWRNAWNSPKTRKQYRIPNKTKTNEINLRYCWIFRNSNNDKIDWASLRSQDKNR